ncbi:MAG: alkaline phosphatase family protein [Candidatus Solibacter usitatus]|nr:alkaline phosphatase family protein [Candidatus Solibacter usitatus]
MLLAQGLAWADPPLLVIALDGFRWDFAARDGARNILALKNEGSSVAGLIPAFPSTTFPNFHSMATGLYPARHGLVAMTFHDRAMMRSFRYDRNAPESVWYGGMPIWLLAEDRGIRTATFFWPGTDAMIRGKRPTYYRRYDPKTTIDARIKQVVEWFRLPERERPGLVMVYFSDVDSAGHQYGPDAMETRAAIARVDQAAGDLVRLVRAVRKDVNVLVVSDHGQIQVASHIDLSKRADFRGCKAANEAPMTMLYCENPEAVRAELIKKAPEVTVWRSHETPEHLHYRGNPRIGDLVIVPKTASIVQVIPPRDTEARPVPRLKGMHGYDPAKYREMNGMLIGAGPAFRSGIRQESAETVDVFLILCRVLGVAPPAGLDADINRVHRILR